MKKVIIIIYCMSAAGAWAQERNTGISYFAMGVRNAQISMQRQKPDMSFLKYFEGVKLISVNTFDSNFQRTYLISQEGDVISSGLMPSVYFQANNNFIVLNANRSSFHDSYNPYGAKDVTSMILLGTFNSVLSRFKLKRKF